MKTKTSLYAAIGVATLLAAPNLFAAYDGTITFNGVGNANPDGGGVFKVNVTTPAGGSQNLGNTWETFCLEYNEHFSPYGYTYDYNLNTGSVAGGTGGQDGTDTAHTGLTMDSVSLGTAWLYSQFRAGTLAGYVDNATSGSALQAAIWWLEAETPVGARNAFIDAAETALSLTHDAAGDAALKVASGGAYGVVALNLFNGVAATSPRDMVGAGGVHYNVNQDMLGIVPEPSTVIAAALLLLPFGASTIRILRKNRIAQV